MPAVVIPLMSPVAPTGDCESPGGVDRDQIEIGAARSDLEAVELPVDKRE